MTLKSIPGGEGGESVGESTGTQVPAHEPAGDLGQTGEALGNQLSESGLAAAESVHSCAAPTTSEDGMQEHPNVSPGGVDHSVLPTALDSTGDWSHVGGELGFGHHSIGFDEYGLLDANSEIPPAQDTSRLEPSTNEVGGSQPADTSLGVQSAILSVGIDKPKFFWEVDPFLKTIFGKEPIGALVMPDVVRPEPAINVETPSGHLVLSLQAKKSQN